MMKDIKITPVLLMTESAAQMEENHNLLSALVMDLHADSGSETRLHLPYIFILKCKVSFTNN